MKKSKNNSVIPDEMPFGRIPFEEIQFGQGSSEKKPLKKEETSSKENSLEEFSFDHILSDEMPFGRIPFEEIQFGQDGSEETPFEEQTADEMPFGRIPFEEIRFGQDGSEETPLEEQASDETSFGRIPFEEIQFGQNESEETVVEEVASEESLLEALCFDQAESEEVSFEKPSSGQSESEEIRFHRQEPEKLLLEEELADEAPFEQNSPDETPSRAISFGKDVLHTVWPRRKKVKRAQSEPADFYSLQEEQSAEFQEGPPSGVFFDDTVDQERNKQGWLRFLIEIAIVIVAALFVFNVVIGISQVSGDSMYPAFQEKDRILYFRLAQNFEKGDVILIRQKDGTKLIKRVIATEGDSLYIDKQDNSVYIDGQLLKEDYVYSNTEITDDSIEYPVVIEEGHVFVMGDNREVSEDSRNGGIGQISKEQITGKVFFQFRQVEKSE